MRSPSRSLPTPPTAPPASPAVAGSKNNRSLRSAFSLANASLATQMLVAGVFCAATGLGICFLLLPATAREFAAGNRVQPILAWLFGGVAAAAMSALLMRRLAARLIHGLDALRSVAGYVIRGELHPLDLMPPAASELDQLRQSLNQMIARLRDARQQQQASQERLAERTQTLDRLLDFSQTVAAAGSADQVYPTLCHFLQAELSLDTVAIFGINPDDLPPLALKARWPAPPAAPESSANPATPIPSVELDASLCPSLRQNQPRHFRCDGSPVRCALEQHLGIAANLSAFCIPFTIGRQHQYTVHMLLPAGEEWTETRRHIAQTYVNTAQSALTSLHMLAEAEQQSMTDPLTGLYNRRSLEQLLEREVALAERHHRPLSLVMIDLDLFKEINDAQGHAAGDHLLRSFADCMRMTLRKTDLAFRYG
ncbi:MAG TPA: GGDEF domain-containing protein, partial [Tepidisphaeraceae bacterium]|nr:GGDEF domain-containing protein [Tepidisphaeraceae bacterium]